MTTNETNHDATQILGTMSIKKIEGRRAGRELIGGQWVIGTIAGHRFDALVFEEHALDPGYELGESRISKLWIKRLADNRTVFNWDRGSDVEAADGLTKQIVDLLAAGLAEMVFGA